MLMRYFYEEQPDLPYRPTFGILISGTLVKDNNGNFIGIKGYRYGKMYMKYEDTPPYDANVYLENSVEVKKHLRPIAPYFDPNANPVWQQYQ